MKMNISIKIKWIKYGNKNKINHYECSIRKVRISLKIGPAWRLLWMFHLDILSTICADITSASFSSRGVFSTWITTYSSTIWALAPVVADVAMRTTFHDNEKNEMKLSIPMMWIPNCTWLFEFPIEIDSLLKQTGNCFTRLQNGFDQIFQESEVFEVEFYDICLFKKWSILILHN